MKRYRVNVNGVDYQVELEVLPEGADFPKVEKSNESEKILEAPKAEGANITSPMQGTILDVKVTKGQQVKAGDVLMILEAMKMENEIMSPSDGTIVALNVEKGTQVAGGAILCVVG